MEANGIRWRLKRGPDLNESVVLQKRLTELQGQQRRLTEQLNETGA